LREKSGSSGSGRGKSTCTYQNYEERACLWAEPKGENCFGGERGRREVTNILYYGEKETLDIYSREARGVHWKGDGSSKKVGKVPEKTLHILGPKEGSSLVCFM